MRNATFSTVRFADSIQEATGLSLHGVIGVQQAAHLAVRSLLRDVFRRLWGSGEGRPAGTALVGGGMAGLAPLERLEGRRLLSAGSVTFSNGLLRVTGDPKAGCNLSVQLSSNGSQVTGNAGGGHILNVASSAVHQVVIAGGSGGDNIYVSNGITVPVTINGGGGADTVRGGGGYNSITLGNGNAWVKCGGTSYVKAGDGNVTLLGGNGNDTLIAGNGNDYLDGSGGNDSQVAGNGNDTLMGDNGNDTLVAGNGTDSINGGLGDDKIITGTGHTTVYSGAGNNTIQLGSSQTIVTSTSGKNTLLNAAGQPTAGAAGQVAGASLAVNWDTYSAPYAGGGAPQAILQVLDPAAMVGSGVVVRGLNSNLGAGSDIDANFQWDFGDASGAHNTMSGFNAGHVYADPGTYTISLTVTNINGKSSTATARVDIAADTRHAIYVNADSGNDANDGSTPNTAVRTAARGADLVGNDTELLFARGQTFDLAQAIGLKYSNVLVGAYGSGAQPVINFTAIAANTVLFTTNGSSAIGVTIQDLTLTTLNGVGFAGISGPPMGINVGGYDTSILRCTFKYLEYDVDAVGNAVGLNVFDDSSPVNGGLDGYFIWGTGGQDFNVYGDTANGSVHEHVLRTSGTVELAIDDNDFYNGDGKGCIELHDGAYGWVDGNTVTGGDIRTGPRGGETEAAGTTTVDVVIEDNKVYNSNVQIDAGSEHIMARNNVVDASAGGTCFDVTGQDGAGRQSSDVRLLNNTGVQTGSSSGQFLYVWSYTDGITLEDNLYVAPTMAIGSQGTAPVYVQASSLAGFTAVTNNVWQSPASSNGWAHGGINFVAPNYVAGGELTAQAWNSLYPVGNDVFAWTNINLSSFAPAGNSAAATAGIVVPGVYGDIYGDARPTSGHWSAGAVQV